MKVYPSLLDSCNHSAASSGHCNLAYPFDYSKSNLWMVWTAVKQSQTDHPYPHSNILSEQVLIIGPYDEPMKPFSARYFAKGHAFPTLPDSRRSALSSFLGLLGRGIWRWLLGVHIVARIVYLVSDWSSLELAQGLQIQQSRWLSMGVWYWVRDSSQIAREVRI